MPSESPKWITLIFTESPKWFALVFSIVAIAISGLSWWESHQGRIISEEAKAINSEVNRPVLAIARDFEIVGFPMKENFMITARVSLKNNGKMTANVSDLDFLTLPLGRPSTCRVFYPKLIGTPDREQKILPGAETLISKNIAVPNCEMAPRSQFLLTLSIAYSDPATGRTYFQEFRKWDAELLRKDQPKPPE